MEWEAPYDIHWILIAFNNICIVFSYYEFVFVKRDNELNIRQFPNLKYTGVEGGEYVFMFCL